MKITIITALALGLCLLGFAIRHSTPSVPAQVASVAPGVSSQYLPVRHAAPEIASDPEVKPQNLFHRAMKHFTGSNGVEIPKLTAQQLEAFLAQNHRSAASLLAAFRASGDPAFLQEAVRDHPGDPQVALAAIFQPDAQPEDRQRWVEAFKQAAPDNSLGSYLSALENFKSGQPAQAVQELQVAAVKSLFQDYSADLIQNAHEAYQAAGYSDADAATAAALGLALPYLPELKDLSQNIGDLAAQYRQAGDSASAQAVLQIGLDLGQRLDSGTATMIQDIVGLSIQRNLLAGLDPGAPYGTAGQTVQNQIDAVTQQRTALQTLAGQQPAVVSEMSDADMVNFFQRMNTSGETTAILWAVNKYAAK